MTRIEKQGRLWQSALILYLIGVFCAYAVMLVLSPRQTLVYRSGWWLGGYTTLLFFGIGSLPRAMIKGQRAYDIGDWFFGRRFLVGVLLGFPALVSFGWSFGRVGVPWFREAFWLYVYTLVLLGSCGLIAWFLRQQRAEHIGMMRRPSSLWNVKIEEDMVWLSDGMQEYIYFMDDILRGQWIFDEREGSHPELVDTIQLFLVSGEVLQVPAEAAGALTLLRYLREQGRLEELALSL
jgi:hypothetical protein